MTEVEVLAQVHRRARVLGVRRTVKRTIPALAAVVALAASVLGGSDGGPSSLRVAGEGTASEGAKREPSPDDRGPRDGEEPPPELSITPSPVSDEPVEVRTPKRVPLLPERTTTPGPRLVDDPEGDDSPDHDAIDLRYGTLAYDKASATVRFVVGVTNLDIAPVGVGYGFRFHYDDLPYAVSVVRMEQQPQPRIEVNSHRCNSCSVEYAVGPDEVRIDVPLAVINERIAADSPRSYSAAWPTGHRQSPPLAEGSRLGWFQLNAYVFRGGLVDGTDETQPHDTADSDEHWTLG